MSLSVVEVTEEQAIKLTPLVDPAGQTQARLPITWCLSDRARERLESEKPSKPYLLIVAMRLDERGEEWVELSRDLVPLNKDFFTVQFQHSGRNVLKAAVVWPGTDRFPFQLKSDLLACEGDGRYKKRVFDSWDGKIYRDSLGSHKRLGCDDGKLVVDVEAELVDNAPSRIGMALAMPLNFFIKKKPRDPCRLRARVLGSLPLWPLFIAAGAIAAAIGIALLVLYELLCAAVTAGTLLVGRRNISYRVFLHPLDFPPKDIYAHTDPSVWTQKKVGRNEYRDRAPFFFLVNPFALLLAASAMVLIPWLFKGGWPEWNLALYGVGFMVGLGIFATVMKRATEETDEERKQRHAREAREREQRYQEWLASLSCENRVNAATQEYEQRSVVLRARDDLKGKVCTPYSS